MPPKKKDLTPDIHHCAAMLLASRGHPLRHVSKEEFSWKYRQRIWEELRPLALGKIDYGASGASFLIRRNRINVDEIRALATWGEYRRWGPIVTAMENEQTPNTGLYH